MPTWRVNATVSGGKCLGDFVAKTKAEAMEKALMSDAASTPLCHQCAEHCEDAELINLTAEKVTD